MTTEIIGYIAQQTAQKPAEMHTATRKAKPIHNISNRTKERLLGVIMIALGALTIPLCGNDATAFVMCFFLGLAAIIGGSNNE